MVRLSITVEQFFKNHGAKLQMKLLAANGGMERIIREPTVNRPGLALSGFTRYYACKRMQVLGNAEVYYLQSLGKNKRNACFTSLFGQKIPCIIFCRGLRPEADFLAAAEKAGVPVFQTPLVTMKFINLATLELEMIFAPHKTEIGSMVDILGIGVLIRGEDGMGKSEAVLELIGRGYSLVSDDVTHLTLIGGHDVMATSPDLTRNYMEIRGIGIINVAAMFGVKRICKEKKLDLVVTLKALNELPDIEQLGIEQEFVKILGVNIPHIFIPVQLGRNLGSLIEIAAYKTKLGMSSYNAAQELEDRLLAKMTAGKPSQS